MKKWLVIFLFGILAAQGIAAQAGKTMFVATKNAELKSATGFFADTVTVLQYGDQVTVVRENGKWMEVKPEKQPSTSGWILSNSLTSKRIVSGSTTSGSADELALAGKGFSAEVERSYSTSSGTAANYQEIDAMEAKNPSGREILSFITEGHLNKGDN